MSSETVPCLTDTSLLPQGGLSAREQEQRREHKVSPLHKKETEVNRVLKRNQKAPTNNEHRGESNAPPPVAKLRPFFSFSVSSTTSLQSQSLVFNPLGRIRCFVPANLLCLSMLLPPHLSLPTRICTSKYPLSTVNTWMSSRRRPVICRRPPTSMISKSQSSRVPSCHGGPCRACPGWS